ncbi:uncharacterized protein [Chelonus insularis]|uniref:uncharacterized protein n=1 Tax=Chelonus insularis TaxID=460826 RepID=UPI00158E5C6C|nr:uncharacterized protein LOC118074773 [Chelonus insularis]
MAAMKERIKTNDQVEETMKPPDGGWGWMIVVAFAVNNLIMVPLITGLGIIFKDLFPLYEISHTDGTIIMSTNMSFGMLMGLTHGPLLQIFGYRKIAIAGGLMFSIGLLLTSFAKTFVHFLISYGILTSFGIGLGMSAFSLALNTYFLEKRGRAMGMGMTITGLGPILMPQLVSILLNSYTSQGVMIILGGLALHTVCAALLLQPVKWHTKRINNQLQNKNSCQQSLEVNKVEKKIQAIIDERDLVVSNSDGQEIIGHAQSIHDIVEMTNNEFMINNPSHKWWNSVKSMESVHLGSCLMIYDEVMVYEKKSIDDYLRNEIDDKEFHQKSCNKLYDICLKNNEILKENKLEDSIDDKCLKKFFNQVINFFDLTLLCDPIYVNIMLGISIAMFAEMNFSILIPFILKDMDFTTKQIATVMSVMATVDLLTRGFAPFIGERLCQTPRNIYLVSLMMLIISRSILIFYTDYIAVMIMATGVGFSKGFRSVFMSLVIPSYVSIDRLPHAAGIQIFVNGIILMVLSPIMGIMRELKGSFVVCIIIINSMTALTIIMSMIEMCITKRISKSEEDKNQYQAVTPHE